MNPNIFESMIELTDVKVSKGVATVFGIIIKADESIEKYVFVLDEVT